jgi:hypothetical protein
MTKAEDIIRTIASIISPEMAILRKKAKEGKLKETGEKFGKTFVKTITAGKVDLDKKGRRRKKK